MSGHFSEYHSRPNDGLSHYEPERCVNCESVFGIGDESLELDGEFWCEWCWGRIHLDSLSEGLRCLDE